MVIKMNDQFLPLGWYLRPDIWPYWMSNKLLNAPQLPPLPVGTEEPNTLTTEDEQAPAGGGILAPLSKMRVASQNDPWSSTRTQPTSTVATLLGATQLPLSAFPGGGVHEAIPSWARPTTLPGAEADRGPIATDATPDNYWQPGVQLAGDTSASAQSRPFGS